MQFQGARKSRGKWGQNTGCRSREEIRIQPLRSLAFEASKGSHPQNGLTAAQPGDSNDRLQPPDYWTPHDTHMSPRASGSPVYSSLCPPKRQEACHCGVRANGPPQEARGTRCAFVVSMETCQLGVLRGQRPQSFSFCQAFDRMHTF